MAAARLRAGPGAATAPRSPVPPAPAGEAPPGSAPRVSSAPRPVRRWNSAAAPSPPPVRGKGLRERLSGRHPRPLLTGQATGIGGRTAPLLAAPPAAVTQRGAARAGPLLPSGGGGARGGAESGALPGRWAAGHSETSAAAAGPSAPAESGRRERGPGALRRPAARPSASLLPCPPRRSPPALTPPSGRGGCAPPGGASGVERHRRGFPHLRSAGWRRAAGRNMAVAAGGRSRWLCPVSCGARGSALRWCRAAGTGRQLLAPCAPPCVLLPRPLAHVIHVAGAARLRLRCDAREFRGSLLGALRRSPALRSFRLVHLVLLSELVFFSSL